MKDGVQTETLSPDVIREFVIATQGAPLEICTAAMMGRKDAVEQMLREDPSLIRARGAHGIPLMAHAALSGDIGLATMLADRGAQEGLSLIHI